VGADQVGCTHGVITSFCLRHAHFQEVRSATTQFFGQFVILFLHKFKAPLATNVVRHPLFLLPSSDCAVPLGIEWGVFAQTAALVHFKFEKWLMVRFGLNFTDRPDAQQTQQQAPSS
jgi:hypothetical protein